MAFLLALLIALIALVSMYIFAAGPWQFPIHISEIGAAYDHQFMVTLVICGVVFFLSQMGLSYMVFRFRDRSGARASYREGNSKSALVWTAILAVFIFGIDMMAELSGEHIWSDVHLSPAPAGALQIEVNGQQFAWNFRYPGPDGKFGRTKPELMKESLGNPLGLDPDDPASKDDLVMPIMAVPVNRPVEISLRSKDVIHSFFVRELRIKQDVVPGMETRLHFTASTVGRYEIPCSQLCGLGHYQMRSFLQVMSQEDFAKWLRDNAPGQ